MPPVTNEPLLSFAPGSQERKELEKVNNNQCPYSNIIATTCPNDDSLMRWMQMAWLGGSITSYLKG